ncbi:CRISPR-associated protein Cas4 [Algoriphagus sp. D3-2-R+10]|uniref:CRISPR-associated protein Cas4 n=1 Tax=Algoriphagus aurantiacus TaxID=3103948 RepID=UPI002B38DDE4|nr:CRISPR-associated protein Cas4 [Algoriphagus sp. D3-2-R+10]MEB2778532.1 CRISPR-associated protein Cas4 [Algoriphagus sp. D3-2-R+10]
MQINATLVNLYHICKRECWLHANGVTMEHTSDTVYDGKLLHENSYPGRNEKHAEMIVEASHRGISLTGKIDFYDARQQLIHETKRSDKAEQAHAWQVKFYLWLLRLNGIEGATAILEYPLLRQTDRLELLEADIDYLEQTVVKIAALKENGQCPPVINAKICKSCSYFDFCYSGEE